LEERIKKADENHTKKRKNIFVYAWFLKQNKKKQILIITTAIFLILALIILVIVLSIIFNLNKSTNTNIKLIPCDLNENEKYYGLINRIPYEICSSNVCPFQLNCCTIINKCKFNSFLEQNNCPKEGFSCKCNIYDSDILHLCSTPTTTSKCESLVNRIY
jgi:hypothetical protein